MHAPLAIDKNVDLTADAELRQIDARLHRKAGARHYSAFFARLQAVHVGAVAVDFLTDGMARAMAEIVAVARIDDDGPASLIDLPAPQDVPVGKRGAHLADRRIAPRRHDGENFLVARG